MSARWQSSTGALSNYWSTLDQLSDDDCQLTLDMLEDREWSIGVADGRAFFETYDGDLLPIHDHLTVKRVVTEFVVCFGREPRREAVNAAYRVILLRVREAT